MFPLYPRTRSLDLESLRRAGRFASPEAEETEAEADKPEEKAGEKPAEKPADTGGRIAVLVDERNTARQEAEKHRTAVERMQKELDQLKANDQTAVVSDLQKKLADLETGTKTRFDKLLEVELAALPDAAAAAVKAIPGGSEVQFDWLIANRALFQVAGAGTEEKKGPEGAKNEKKPAGGKAPGISAETQARIDRANARVKKGSGWAIVTG